MPDVFLLHPHSTDMESAVGRLTGYTPTSRPRHVAGCAGIVIILPIVFFMTFLFLNPVAENLRFALSSAESEAQVMTCQTGSTRSGGWWMTLDYVFTVRHNGQRLAFHAGRDTLFDSWRQCDQAPVGSRVRIEYRPENPDDNRVIRPDIQVFSLFGLTLLELLAGGLAFLLWAMLLRGIRDMARDRRTRGRANTQFAAQARAAQILSGEIMGITGETRYDQPGSPYEVSVDYRFTTPDGLVLRGSARAPRDDLRYAVLPAPGTPVRVVYMDDKTHTML